jgi:transposase-like protein
MTDARAFRGFRFPAEVILWAVRWYLAFPVSYRDLERMLADRGRRGRPHDHVPLGPALRPRAREAAAPASAPCRGPWHVDETYVRVRRGWRYLYRAVDGAGQTIDFLLSAKRDKKARRRFLRQALARDNTRNPREVVTDRLKSYPGAIAEMKRDGELWRFTRHRRGRWLNNLVEQDHRRVKRRTRPMLGFRASGRRGGRWPGWRPCPCCPRDRCAPCPGMTCRRSGPSSTKPSVSPPDRKGADRSSPAASQRNGTHIS